MAARAKPTAEQWEVLVALARGTRCLQVFEVGGCIRGCWLLERPAGTAEAGAGPEAAQSGLTRPVPRRVFLALQGSGWLARLPSRPSGARQKAGGLPTLGPTEPLPHKLTLYRLSLRGRRRIETLAPGLLPPG